MNVDTLIVGLGIVGLNYAEQLRKNNVDFVVIAPEEQSASHIAAGIVNPTVLKRFNAVWNAETFLNCALPVYNDLEVLLGTKILYRLPIHRIFNSTQEQNEWGIAASSAALEKFLNKEWISNNRQLEINAPFGFGALKESARVDTQRLLTEYRIKIIPDRIVSEKINHQDLGVEDGSITYKNIKAKKVVFCQGYSSVVNPYFSYLPLIGSKGEILIIECEALSEQVIYKGPIFLSPMGNHKYWVGATFDRTDKSTKTSINGREWLISKLNQFLKLPYTILEQRAEIRATVQDRRPLLGVHPKHKNMFILNGVGTRGVLMSPLLSQWLFEFIENNKKLPASVNINRFENKYFRN